MKLNVRHRVRAGIVAAGASITLFAVAAPAAHAAPACDDVLTIVGCDSGSGFAEGLVKRGTIGGVEPIAGVDG